MSKIALIFVFIAVYSTGAIPVPEPEAYTNIYNGERLPEQILLRDYPNFNVRTVMRTLGDDGNYARGIAMVSDRTSGGAHGQMMINENGEYRTLTFRK